MSTFDELVVALERAQHPVFLTGAGVSTHSGIPDYRSKTGIYADKISPEELLSHENLRQHPASFYQFVKTRMYYPQAQPNLIHREIARLCQNGGRLITQNVDGLDLKAGNPHVIEFHGDLYDLYCQTCGQPVDAATYLHDFHHQADQGIIRPRIVLYGELIDSERLRQAVMTMRLADLILIVGTSFRVYPFAQLLQDAPASAAVYAINREPIWEPGIKMIQDDALAVFKKISEVL